MRKSINSCTLLRHRRKEFDYELKNRSHESKLLLAQINRNQTETIVRGCENRRNHVLRSGLIVGTVRDSDRPQFSCTATGAIHSACSEQTQHSTIKIEKLRTFVFYAWLVCSSKLVRCRLWPVPLWTRTFWPILERKASSSNPKPSLWVV